MTKPPSEAVFRCYGVGGRADGVARVATYPQEGGCSNSRAEFESRLASNLDGLRPSWLGELVSSSLA